MDPFSVNCQEWAKEPYWSVEDYFKNAPSTIQRSEAFAKRNAEAKNVVDNGGLFVGVGPTTGVRGLVSKCEKIPKGHCVCWYDGYCSQNRHESNRQDGMLEGPGRTPSHVVVESGASVAKIDGIDFAIVALDEYVRDVGDEHRHAFTAECFRNGGLGGMANSSHGDGNVKLYEPNCKLECVKLWRGGPEHFCLVATMDIHEGEEILWKYNWWTLDKQENKRKAECGFCQGLGERDFCPKHVIRPCCICERTKEGVLLYCHRCGFTQPGGWFAKGAPPLRDGTHIGRPGNLRPQRRPVVQQVNLTRWAELSPLEILQSLGLEPYPAHLQVGYWRCRGSALMHTYA